MKYLTNAKIFFFIYWTITKIEPFPLREYN